MPGRVTARMPGPHVTHDARPQIQGITLAHDRSPDHGESSSAAPVTPSRFHLQARRSRVPGFVAEFSTPKALPHFWWKGISPRAVIPLEANAVLGSAASCCQFAIGAARKIDKGAALQDVAAPRWP